MVAGDTHVVVDTTPDFRTQVLRSGIRRIDAVLFTHAHADHIFGLDDVRRFNTIQDEVIPAYGTPETLADVRQAFSYIGTAEVAGVFRPRLTFEPIEQSVTIGGLTVTPLDVAHGPMRTVGYRFDANGHRLGYFPDCASMSDDVVGELQGADVMILDALRHRPHGTHLSVSESLRYLARVGARQSYITHMTHDLDHAATEAEMPRDVRVPSDGLTIEW